MGGLRLAQVKVNSEFTAPCNTSILYPADGGNMHCFTAMTPCAVLDVLGPPYCDSEGRHCQYYLDFPLDSYSGTGHNAYFDINFGCFSSCPCCFLWHHMLEIPALDKSFWLLSHGIILF